MKGYGDSLLHSFPDTLDDLVKLGLVIYIAITILEMKEFDQSFFLINNKKKNKVIHV